MRKGPSHEEVIKSMHSQFDAWMKEGAEKRAKSRVVNVVVSNRRGRGYTSALGVDRDVAEKVGVSKGQKLTADQYKAVCDETLKSASKYLEDLVSRKPKLESVLCVATDGPKTAKPPAAPSVAVPVEKTKRTAPARKQAKPKSSNCRPTKSKSSRP
jgi:hypothetical protein